MLKRIHKIVCTHTKDWVGVYLHEKQPHTVARGACHHPVDSTCSNPIKKWLRHRAYLKTICFLCLLYSVLLNVHDWQAASDKRVVMMRMMI